MGTASRHLAVPIFGPTCIQQAVEEIRVPRPHHGAPLSTGVAYGLKGAATLLLRSSGAVGGRDEPPDVQAFELTHLSHPHHVPTLCSALVDRAAQNVIYVDYLWTDIFTVHRAVEALLNAST